MSRPLSRCWQRWRIGEPYQGAQLTTLVIRPRKNSTYKQTRAAVAPPRYRLSQRGQKWLAALGFIVVLLLHFSAAVSRLNDQSKVLAQRLALMEQRMHQLESDPLHDPGDRRLLDEARARRFAPAAGSRERDQRGPVDR